MTKRSNSSRNKTLVENAIKRDGKCMLCGTTEGLAVHHIIPIADGGTDTIDNMITLCDKHHYLYHHWPEDESFGTRKLLIKSMDKKAHDGYAQYKAPFGYGYIDGKLVVNEDEAITIKDIYKAYIREKSTLRVSRIFNLPRSLIYRILTNETYLGKVKWRNEIIDGEHQLIIDKDSFDKVGQILSERRKR